MDQQPLPISAHVGRHIHGSGCTDMLPGMFRHGIVQPFHTSAMEEMHNALGSRIDAAKISEIPPKAEVGRCQGI